MNTERGNFKWHHALSVVALALALLGWGPAIPASAGGADNARERNNGQAGPSTQIVAERNVYETLIADGEPIGSARAIAQEDSAAARAAAVPTCVTARYENPLGPYQDVYVRNRCAVTQRVKVIWAYATDSRCYSISPGSRVRDRHFNQTFRDRWDGLRQC